MTLACALPSRPQLPICQPRWHVAAALALGLFLAGCATVDTGSGGNPSSTGEAVSTAPSAPRLPSYRLPGNIPLSDIGVASTSVAPVASLAAPADLWERIRRGFAMTDLDSDLVRDQERWYATRPDYIQRMTERSSRYLFHIVEEIERRNMPMELALLPFIESAFNPQAVSSARAAGMWQFMPATGQSFDLKQNAFRDDRRDVLASTRAALDYLQQLHGRFGDWHLALAAYNWGQGNVNRAITNNKRQGLPTGYLDINMPLETRTYVPKLQAVKNIMARPQAYSATLPLIGNHPFFDTVTLERDIDVAVIARMAEVSEADFRALNPSLKQPVVMASGTPNILLPWDNAVIFQNKLQAHTGPLASWTAWVLPSTMTVAQAASRAGMSESELREVNNIPPRMSLRAGSSLLVPRTGQRNTDVPLHVADNAQLNLQPDVVLQRSVVKARKGDTLARLAQRHGVSAVSVAGWNKLAVNAALKPGQQVTLMLPRRVSLASGGPTAKKQAATTATTRKVAKSTSQPTKLKAKTAAVAVAKKKSTTQSAASSSAKTRLASTAKADKRP